MDEFADDEPRRPPGARDALRLVLPVFVVSALVMVVGLVLALNGHRSLGIFFIVVGALGGFAVRARLMFRSQQGPPRS